MISSKCEVEHILSDMRKAISDGKFLPVNRKKNLDTLTQLGLTWPDAKDEIYHLEFRHYHSGPETDRDDPLSDQLWIFKKRIENDQIYIKLKILYQEDRSIKVISFHIDEI